LALSVPLSRFTSQVGGGSAFFVRHQDRFKIFRAGWFGEDLSSLIWMSKLSEVSQDSARAGLMRRASAALVVGERLDLPDLLWISRL
jgi:hypothetical protein